MAFKTFAPGVLTSSDVNTFLMRQAIITCTSATRPASPSEGMTIYETDTDAYAVYTGSAWSYQGYYEDYTPSIGGAWTLGNGSTVARWTRIGKVSIFKGVVVVGSTTSVASSGNLEIGWPSGFTFSGGGSAGGVDSRRGQIGSVRLEDVSSGESRYGQTAVSTNILVSFLGVLSNVVRPQEINTTAFTAWTWAAGDSIRWNLTVEEA